MTENIFVLHEIKYPSKQYLITLHFSFGINDIPNSVHHEMNLTYSLLALRSSNIVSILPCVLFILKISQYDGHILKCKEKSILQYWIQ